MKGVVVKVSGKRSIVLFNNGKIGSIPTPPLCQVGTVISVRYNKRNVLGFGLILLVLAGILTFIGVTFFRKAPHHAATEHIFGATLIVTIEQAKQFPEDTEVIVTGTIVRSLGDKTYILQDPTGEIAVEIDKDALRGMAIRESDTLEIRGEVEFKKKGIIIDANRVQKK